jgi:hypothetical protein
VGLTSGVFAPIICRCPAQPSCGSLITLSRKSCAIDIGQCNLRRYRGWYLVPGAWREWHAIQVCLFTGAQGARNSVRYCFSCWVLLPQPHYIRTRTRIVAPKVPVCRTGRCQHLHSARFRLNQQLSPHENELNTLVGQFPNLPSRRRNQYPQRPWLMKVIRLL